MDFDEPIYLSIVAPAYNEAENLPQLVAESVEAGEATGKPFEIVLADDCSDDGSGEVLERLRAETPLLRVLDMRERSGQSFALAAALTAARGQYIATLDADCQNDPRDIPRLLKILEAGQCDYINGWRKDRQDTGFRRLISRWGNAFRNCMTRETIHDSGCGLKVFRRECIERLKLFDGGHRFFVSMVRMEGFRVAEEVVRHRPRRRGVAKYGFLDRFFKVLRDAVAVRWMQNHTRPWKASERGGKTTEK
jgi:dolichol-phosphate mannosyltransferase